MPLTWKTQDREILRLAVPAFFALVSEPLMLLADSAIVGHLGTPQLAALGVAGTILQTLVGICVFLAYGTTSAVARRIGAGDHKGALAQGIDGLWLALLLGVVLAVAGLLFAPLAIAGFHPSPDVADYAVTYLRISCLGIPSMLLLLAATGVLRGLQDTKTPMVVAVSANLANIALNFLLVYGLDLNIAGSALGTAIAQTAAGAALVVVVVRGARRDGAKLRPDRPGILASAHAGVPLVVRTLTLRVAIVLTTFVATSLGTTSVAAHQVAFTLWSFLALALDAIAIAAQALTGRSLGAGDVVGTRAITRRMMWWGLASGVVGGLALWGLRDLYVPLFTKDPEVRHTLAAILLVAAIWQPVNGVVFVLDGVLIGAGDGPYLAVAGIIALLLFAPLALSVQWFDRGIVALWWAFGGYMLLRFLTLTLRERRDGWLVTGAVR
ncbi:putative MATE family efflux protein [Kribbella voronezhensis]|uniref:Putative MATE family efflux protein n=1 Tax=Kribbella voronezhensis TaxID=2512212 RepID=A0A4R7TDW5_9ACTN|nr:MATE family efflux transporter [Kribbella voronezhensis]TDU89979.1 putative MATE family efflux protein [Kribbella voronezhensis]